MLVFNSIYGYSVNPLGGEVDKFIRHKFEKAVVFADMAEFITCLNEELLKVNAKYPRCKHFFAQAYQYGPQKFNYTINVHNGTKNCCVIKATVVNTAFYYNPDVMRLERADKGVGIIK